MALDTKLVQEETQQVERAITDQTNDLDATVTSLREQHATLVRDVADLERRLEIKRREGACWAAARAHSLCAC